jgi:hypothetical protein
MPTLPEEPERPAGPAERVGMVARRASAAIGADKAVTVRALLAFALIIVGLSFSAQPWQWIGLLATLSLAFDWMRVRGRP